MLTSKELMLIQDNIKMNQTMASFLSSCAQSAADSQLKSMCQNMASSHQQSIKTLSNHITNQNLQ